MRIPCPALLPLAALLASAIIAPSALAQSGTATLTRSTTQRVPPPPGFDEAFGKQDYEGAFILISDAIVTCVKSAKIADECLDLLLIGTNSAARAKVYEPAETLATEAARITDLYLPETDPDRLTASQNLASVLDALKRPGDAIPWHRKALALAELQRAPDDEAIGNSLAALATDLNAIRDYAGQVPVERQLLVWRQKFAPQNVATGHADLASALKQLGQRDEAELEYAIAQKMFADRFGEGHDYARSTERSRIENLEAAGRRRDMVPLLTVRAARTPPDIEAIRWLGQVQQALGNYAAAEDAYRRAVAVLRADPKPDLVLLADSIAGVAAALDSRDRSAEAEAVLREAIAILPRDGREKDRELKFLNNLAGAVMSQGRYAEAESLYSALVAGRRSGNPLDLALALSNLSVALDSLNRLDEAARVQAEATALRRANLPADDAMIALSESIQAGIEEQRSGYPAGLALRRSAYAIFRKTLGPDHPRTANAAQSLALALAFTRTDPKEMTALLVEARRVMATLDPDSYNRIVNGSYLAVSMLGIRNPDADPARARLLLLESVSGIHARVARFRDFGTSAQQEMRSYGPIFTQQVQAAWELMRKSQAK